MILKRSLSHRSSLRGYGSFSRVMGKGDSVAAGPIRCYFVSAQAQRGLIRVGVAVTRNIRGAVRRNRLRRLLRESLRLHQQVLTQSHQAEHRRVEAVILFSGPLGERGHRIHRGEIDKYMLPLLATIARKL